MRAVVFVLGGLAIKFMVVIVVLPSVSRAIGLPRWAAFLWLVVVIGLFAFMTGFASGWPR